MTTSITIHPQLQTDALKFSCGSVSTDNANAVTLKFSSREYNDREGVSPFKAFTEITAFRLDEATAQCLSALGRMTPETRAKIIPALMHALDEQEA